MQQTKGEKKVKQKSLHFKVILGHLKGSTPTKKFLFVIEQKQVRKNYILQS